LEVGLPQHAQLRILRRAVEGDDTGARQDLSPTARELEKILVRRRGAAAARGGDGHHEQETDDSKRQRGRSAAPVDLLALRAGESAQVGAKAPAHCFSGHWGRNVARSGRTHPETFAKSPANPGYETSAASKPS